MLYWAVTIISFIEVSRTEANLSVKKYVHLARTILLDCNLNSKKYPVAFFHFQIDFFRLHLLGWSRPLLIHRPTTWEIRPTSKKISKLFLKFFKIFPKFKLFCACFDKWEYHYWKFQLSGNCINLGYQFCGAPLRLGDKQVLWNRLVNGFFRGSLAAYAFSLKKFTFPLVLKFLHVKLLPVKTLFIWPSPTIKLCFTHSDWKNYCPREITICSVF